MSNDDMRFGGDPVRNDPNFARRASRPRDGVKAPMWRHACLPRIAAIGVDPAFLRNRKLVTLIKANRSGSMQ